jgi:hypothetical protein
MPHLFHTSSDGVQKDLLANLHDFPLVPGGNSLHTGKPSPVIYEEERVSKDDFGLSFLAIDTSGQLLGAPSSEEERAVDVTDDFLHASQILRKYVPLCSRALRS